LIDEEDMFIASVLSLNNATWYDTVTVQVSMTANEFCIGIGLLFIVGLSVCLQI
jgi:hypothetical protein